MPEHENGRPDEEAATPLEPQGNSESTSPAPRAIRNEVVVSHDPHRGRVLLLLPVVPEDAPHAIREGIRRRRTAALTGACPCGASVELHAAVRHCEHLHGCPAADAVLVRAIRRWAQ